MNTPIVFIIFKRPDTTKQVFEVIRQAKPKQLFVIADGPRTHISGEAEKCNLTRAIIEQVDWECKVVKNYSDINLGCGKRISSGLDWVFQQVEEAIILEDDCLPHPTFFPFCEKLLEKYRYDDRIASISGQNVQFGRNKSEYSYYFSRYNHIWGWATWKRAWKEFDFDISLWPEVKKHNFLREILKSNKAIEAWNKVFQDIYRGNKHTWDFQWQFACWVNNRLGIISNVNLVSNIGFDMDSHHTLNPRSRYSKLPIQGIDLVMNHPPFMVCNTAADIFTQETLFSGLNPSILQRFIWKLKKLL